MSAPRLRDARSAIGLRWPETELGRLARAYLSPMLRESIPAHVENAHGELLVLEDGDLVLPLVVTEDSARDTYVVSLHAQYVGLSASN